MLVSLGFEIGITALSQVLIDLTPVLSLTGACYFRRVDPLPDSSLSTPRLRVGISVSCIKNRGSSSHGLIGDDVVVGSPTLPHSECHHLWLRPPVPPFRGISNRHYGARNESSFHIKVVLANLELAILRKANRVLRYLLPRGGT